MSLATTPAPAPAPVPTPAPAPVPAPTPIYQEIVGYAKAGYAGGRYVSLSSFIELPAGFNIKGGIQLEGAFTEEHDIKWYFQIVDPNNNIERSWLRHIHLFSDEGTSLDFDYVTSSSGVYSLRVINNSFHDFNFKLYITPRAWYFDKTGAASYAWLITK